MLQRLMRHKSYKTTLGYINPATAIIFINRRFFITPAFSSSLRENGGPSLQNAPMLQLLLAKHGGVFVSAESFDMLPLFFRVGCNPIMPVCRPTNTGESHLPVGGFPPPERMPGFISLLGFEMAIQRLRERTELTGNRYATFWAAFSIGLLIIASGGVSQADEPKLRNSLQGHRQQVTYVVFSPDGKTLASTSGDLTTVVHNLATGSSHFIRRTLHIPAEFSTDGKTLVLPSATRQPHCGGILHRPDGEAMGYHQPEDHKVLRRCLIAAGIQPRRQDASHWLHRWDRATLGDASAS